MRPSSKVMCIVMILLLSGANGSILLGAEFTVDAAGAGDFTNIQEAINTAWDFDSITVNPGVYHEHISYQGKLITITSQDPNDPNVVENTVIDGDGEGNVVMFISAENAYSVLRGFTIRNGNTGIRCVGADTQPVIERCVIASNKSGVTASNARPSLRWNTITGNTENGIAGCDGEVVHCTVSHNGGCGLSDCGGLIGHSTISANNQSGIYDHWGEVRNCLITANLADGIRFEKRRLHCAVWNCTIVGNKGHGVSVTMGDTHTICTFVNCIVVQNRRYGINKSVSSQFAADTVVKVDFSNVWGNESGSYHGSHWPITVGEDNLHVRPYFANGGYWDPDGTWQGGDYHLRSTLGRWDPRSDSWATDPIDSPCLDKGDPCMPTGDEPYPHGGVINMGAYGGTAEASKSTAPQPMCIEYPEMDFNKDCKVDLADFTTFMEHWLECNLDDPDACWPDGIPESPIVPGRQP